MQSDFKQPYPFCLAYLLQDFFGEHTKKEKPAAAHSIPSIPLPEAEELPRFFQLLETRDQEVAGEEEIRMGYNGASSTYEDYWLSVASGPIDEMFQKLSIKRGNSAVDCGCGTGFSTAILANLVGTEGKIIAIDLSSGMIEKAKVRIRQLGLSNVEFRVGDVLKELKKIPEKSINIAVLTWLIGYVGCREIFPLLKRILKPGGIVGFVAHLDRSPLIPIEVFEEITREKPQSLMKAVKLKFPKNGDEIVKYLKTSGFETKYIKQDTFNFICHKGNEVFDHVMKSGAGTTFYYALKSTYRKRLAKEFVRRIDNRYKGAKEITILHEYVVGIGIS